MSETKSELYDRLRAAGLWPEAAAWKDAKVKELRAQGMSRAAAKEEAWQRLEQQYPPAAEPAKEPAEPKPEPEDEPEDRAEVSVSASRLPDAWGVLPDSAPFDAEVEWVHQNMVLVIEERGSKRPEFHWERAQRPAPSYGAVNVMHFAATNRKGFVDILQRMKPGMAGDEEVVRREKVKIAEIRRILEELRGAKATHAPEAVRDRVEGALADWGRQHGVTLSADAADALQAHVVDLVVETTGEAAEEKPTTPPMSPAE